MEPWNDGLRKWNVSWNSYAESGGEHSYTLILRQAEELSLESLVVGDVELHPYAYREAVSGAELTVWAKCVGSKTEVLRLRALLKDRSSFPVIRHGISDQPRPMRFGVAEWSEHEGRIKFRVIFVDRDADPGEHPELVRIEEENTRAAAGYYMNFVRRAGGAARAAGHSVDRGDRGRAGGGAQPPPNPARVLAGSGRGSALNHRPRKAVSYHAKNASAPASA